MVYRIKYYYYYSNFIFFALFSCYSLPDLNAADVAHAAVKIQAAYKGFKVRKAKNQTEDLPDLKDKSVQDATIKIQCAFKGFAVRKHNKEQAKAASMIQKNFKGYLHRKKAEKIFAATVDQAMAAIKIQKVYRYVCIIIIMCICRKEYLSRHKLIWI